MKIKIITPCKFSFHPSEPIAYFKENEIYDLPVDRAEMLIKSGYAKELNKTSNSDQKMSKIEPENKMFNVKHKEDKTAGKVKVKHEEKDKNPKKTK